MQATIRYQYDTDGQRASLIAGGDGKTEQTIIIDVGPADLDLLTLASDGTMSAEAHFGYKLANRGYGDSAYYVTDYAPQRFSSVPSPADLILFLRQRAAQKLALETEARQKNEQAAEAARTGKEDRRRTQIEQLAADLAAGKIDDGTYGYVSRTYPDLSADELADLTARRKARDEQKAGVEALLARVKALKCGEVDLRETTLLADGTYQFDVPDPKNCDWAKRVESIDSSAKNGYAFRGDWLPKPGQSANLPAGELILVGGKYWSGSRKRGEWNHEKNLYIVTPAGVRFLDDSDCRATAIEYLALTPAERVTKALEAARATAAGKIAKLDALDATEFAPVAGEIKTRRDSQAALLAACERALNATPADQDITDIDSAAAAIVAAGFRALSKTHHPDAGGSAETMALLSQARQQLREMLTLAGGVR